VDGDWLTNQFEDNRGHLGVVAFRILGSSAKADDAVQEAWLRFSGAASDAWLAYQALLSWADAQGLDRRPAETTRQFSTRLTRALPADAAPAVELVTRAFEYERNGGLPPAAPFAQRLRAALATLVSR
jgi:DNA-directed RNA polymerase specialized sigma24 family protein